MMKRLGFPSFRSAGPLAVLAAIGLALGLSPANHLLAGEANEGYEFHGVVQGLPSGSTLVGDWKVGDKVIHVTAATAFPKERKRHTDRDG